MFNKLKNIPLFILKTYWKASIAYLSLMALLLALIPYLGFETYTRFAVSLTVIYALYISWRYKSSVMRGLAVHIILVFIISMQAYLGALYTGSFAESTYGFASPILAVWACVLWATIFPARHGKWGTIFLAITGSVFLWVNALPFLGVLGSSILQVAVVFLAFITIYSRLFVIQRGLPDFAHSDELEQMVFEASEASDYQCAVVNSTSRRGKQKAFLIFNKEYAYILLL